MTYYQKAVQYAFDIVGGEIRSCKAVYQACERFINDIELAETKAFKYYFNPSHADHLCEFIENLPHTKGAWASKKELIKLEPWQCLILCNIGGWLEKGTDKRRFRKAYIQVARKNGKSIFAAGIGLYMLTADGEFGSEVYCGATNEKQAFEVFTPARIMCERTPDLLDHFGVDVFKRVISRAEDNAKFEPVIGNPPDGASPHCGIVDEYHEHQSNITVETFETGMGARAMEGSPLLLIITTAGHNLDGPCFDEYQICKKVLEGSEKDERLFAIIYELDESDEWTDPENLIKANPNLDVSVSKDFLIDSLEVAKKDTKRQNSFKTKHQNRWVNAAASWLNFEEWRKCGEELSEDDFVGWDCIHSIDLASKCDIAAYVKTFFKYLDGKLHYYCFPKFFLPSEAVISDKSGKYARWLKAGYLIQTEGQEIDFEFIKKHILEDSKKFGALEVAFDPWNCTKIAQELAEEGLLVVEFGQTTKNMSGPMYECEGAIKAGRFHHPGNDAFDWMASNVVVKPDHNDNIFPRKERASAKIDGAVCMIMGVARAMSYEDKTTDYTDGLMVL